MGTLRNFNTLSVLGVNSCLDSKIFFSIFFNKVTTSELKKSFQLLSILSMESKNKEL